MLKVNRRVTKKDFTNYFNTSLKSTNESKLWIALLRDSKRTKSEKVDWLLKELDETFLVMNGDVLSDLDYTELVRFHHRQNAMATIAMYDKEIKIDLGIINTNDQHEIYDYVEKPTLTYQVSMGIYVFNKQVMQYIPRGKYFDLPDLIHTLIKADEKIVGYHFKGYWRDIGRREDYEQAIEEFEMLKSSFVV